MAWTYIGFTTATPVASGDITGTEPSGTQEGDLLVAFIAYRDTPAFTNPALWSTVATQQSTGNTSTTVSTSIASGHMAWIVRGSSAPALTWTRTLGDVAMLRVVTYRGNKRISPYDTGSANTLGANSLTVTTTGFSTAEANELLVAGAALSDNTSLSAFDAATDPTTASGATDTTTMPTAGTWIERVDANTSTGADAGIGIGDAIRSAAGATGTLQYTAGANSRHVLIVGAFKIAPLSTITRTAVGAGSVPVPAGVNWVDTEVIGPGGGGFLGGGSGGGYSRTTGLAVTPGGTIFFSNGVVGVGDSNDGGDSWINVSANTTPATVAVGTMAKGGRSPNIADFSGLPGGAAASGVGHFKFSGGAGANNNGVTGGGGGGSAGSAGNGGAGGQPTAGIAGTPDGGAGSAGEINNNAANGNSPGGGGGGSFNGDQGNGAPGIIKISFRYMASNPPPRRPYRFFNRSF